jgi:hypothetical protein
MDKYFRAKKPIMQNSTMVKINMNEIIMVKIKMVKLTMNK